MKALKMTKNQFPNFIRNTVAFALLAINSASAVIEPELKLSDVQKKFYGKNYLNPSPESLVGKYLRETNAQTVVKRFWRGTPNSVIPPRELGPERLVVAVDANTFPVFKNYFSSRHFLYFLNEHGNKAAFMGKRSGFGGNGINFQGNILSEDFQFRRDYGDQLIAPILLDTNEGNRTENYFELSKHFLNTHYSKDYSRSPYLLLSGDSGRYTGRSAYAGGCATWFGNLPIGNKLVDEFVFASGDDGESPIQPKLKEYIIPEGFTEEVKTLLRKVWTVPGHQQLGEILDPGANRRGEFENTGWTGYTLFGSSSVERIPIVFLFVADASVPLDPDFPAIMDVQFPNDVH